MIEYLKEQLLNKVQKEVDSLGVGGLKGKISDGYHTFDELYKHRVTLFMAFCRVISELKYENTAYVWMSEYHSDKTKFNGWFILGINDKKGSQITYHLPNSEWNECSKFAEVLGYAPEFDGHTSDDVLARIRALAGIKNFKVSSHQTDLQGANSGQLQQHDVMGRSELLDCQLCGTIFFSKDELKNHLRIECKELH